MTFWPEYRIRCDFHRRENPRSGGLWNRARPGRLQHRRPAPRPHRSASRARDLHGERGRARPVRYFRALERQQRLYGGSGTLCRRTSAPNFPAAIRAGGQSANRGVLPKNCSNRSRPIESRDAEFQVAWVLPCARRRRRRRYCKIACGSPDATKPRSCSRTSVTHFQPLPLGQLRTWTSVVCSTPFATSTRISTSRVCLICSR